MNKDSFEDFCLELAKLIGTHNAYGFQLYLCHILGLHHRGYPFSIIRRQMLQHFGRHAFKRHRAKLFDLINEIQDRGNWSFGTLAGNYYETKYKNSARIRWLKDLAQGRQPL